MSLRRSEGHARSRAFTPARPWGLLALGLLLLVGLPARPAAAADAGPPAALAACVDAHLMPDDSQTMMWVLVTVIADVQPKDSDMHAYMAARRDGAISDAAKLFTRLGQGCKAELQAAGTGAPGSAFGQLFGMVMQHSLASLRGPEGRRAGTVFAFDLLKKLDSSVAADLFGPNAPAMIAAPPASPAPGTPTPHP